MSDGVTGLLSSMKGVFWLLIVGLAASGAAPASALQFSPQEMSLWRSESFKGHTLYALAMAADRPALRARCDASASGLFLDQTIDLMQTPIIEWSWRVSQPLNHSADERTKTGDDYAARIYVVKKDGLFPWRTRAINYVWSSRMPENVDWPNAYARQAHMIAVRSGSSPALGAWVTERRNVREDFRRYHGVDLAEIDLVAIMTDCDDQGSTAEAWYGDIRFLPGN